MVKKKLGDESGLVCGGNFLKIEKGVVMSCGISVDRSYDDEYDCGEATAELDHCIKLSKRLTNKMKKQNFGR